MRGSDVLPIFPLHQVLLPEAALSLRVFERRHLDMLRGGGRHGGRFGACLMLSGGEAGVPATPAAWGVEAHVEDFDTSPDGLLQLRVRGARRFRVRRTRVRDNGLLVAEVGWREPDGDDELRPEHALLGTVLGHMLARAGQDDVRVPARRFDEAGWVGWRLADLLPLGASQRLALLQEDDVHARLDRLLGWMG